MKYGDERKSMFSSVLHASRNSPGPELFSRENVYILVGTLSPSHPYEPKKNITKKEEL